MFQVNSVCKNMPIAITKFTYLKYCGSVDEVSYAMISIEICIKILPPVANMRRQKTGWSALTQSRDLIHNCFACTSN